MITRLPIVSMQTCGPYRARLSADSCAKRYLRARDTNDGAEREQFAFCLGCKDGERNSAPTI